MTTIGIGTLYRNRDIIEGPVRTLLFQDRIRLVPNPHAAASPKAPDLLVYSGDDHEIGEAWACRREDRAVFYNVQIRDPHVAKPIHATLCPSDQDGDRFDLFWSH